MLTDYQVIELLSLATTEEIDVTKHATATKEPETDVTEREPETDTSTSTSTSDAGTGGSTSSEPEAKPHEPTTFDYVMEALNKHVKNGFPQQGGHETDKAFTERMIIAVAEFSDEVYNELPVAVTKWHESEAVLLNAKKPFKAPEGFVSRYGSDLANEPKTGRVRNVAAKPPKEKKEKVARPKKEKAPKEPKPAGTVSQLREIMVLNYPCTRQAFDAAVAAAGIKGAEGGEVNPSTLAVVYSDSKSVLGWVAAHKDKLDYIK